MSLQQQVTADLNEGCKKTSDTPERSWREIAKEVSSERDSDKVAKLSEELIEERVAESKKLHANCHELLEDLEKLQHRRKSA